MAHAGDAGAARPSADVLNFNPATAASAPQLLPSAPSDPWDFAALQPREPAAGACAADTGRYTAGGPSEGSLREARGADGGIGLAHGGAGAGRDESEGLGFRGGSAALAAAGQPPGEGGDDADGMSSLVPPEVRYDPAPCADCLSGFWHDLEMSVGS